MVLKVTRVMMDHANATATMKDFSAGNVVLFFFSIPILHFMSIFKSYEPLL